MIKTLSRVKKNGGWKHFHLPFRRRRRRHRRSRCWPSASVASRCFPTYNDEDEDEDDGVARPRHVLLEMVNILIRSCSLIIL
uniref:Uncharacterized protein n=1 Tax=Vespula pensylvanica TaxID=30213 RepID=A0A834JKU1_VESPE|nr:hypothetical protein H0235_017560 [Vespula pensylvanica]